MADDSAGDPQLSRKELARQFRRAAYQRAKEHRANDPKQVTMKEAMKLRRCAEYKAGKERRKAFAAEQKTRREARESESRALKARELMKLVKPLTER
jgi:hypothetical protein